MAGRVQVFDRTAAERSGEGLALKLAPENMETLRRPLSLWPN